LRRDILQNDLVGLINGLRWAVEVVMCTIGWSSIVMWKVVFLDSSDSMCMKFCVGSFDKGKWVSAWLAMMRAGVVDGYSATLSLSPLPYNRSQG